MERGYIKGKDLEISSPLILNDGVNPESDPYSNTYYGIFKCIKKDLDFIRANNFNIPYISDKTTLELPNGSTSPFTIDTVSCEPGDLLLMFGALNDAQTWSTEPGWTLESQSGNDPAMVVYSRIATGTENSTYSFDWTGDASTRGSMTMLCIKKYSSFNVGSFGAQINPPTIPVPDDASDKKLLIFVIGNDGPGRFWNITALNEYQIVDLQGQCSLDVSAIYRTSSNTSLSYETTQDGAGPNSHGLTIVVK